MFGMDTIGGWLDGLGSSLGNIFGSSTPATPKIDDTLGTLFGSPGYPTHPQAPDSLGGTSLWPSIITAGSGLINSFFTQSQNSSLAEQYAQQQKAALDAQLAAAAKAQETQKEIAAMYSGATVKAAAIAAGAAKKNTLAGLYNNWANATERGGEATGQEAQNIGGMVGRSLDARQASLR